MKCGLWFVDIFIWIVDCKCLLDGEPAMLDDFLTYTFVSEFARDDIDYTLQELFPAEMEATERRSSLLCAN